MSQSFYKNYYKPNNAVLVITGDFESQTAKDLVQKYFGSIPKGDAPPVTDTSEPVQTKQRVNTVTDPFATTPAIFMSWPAPPLNSPDTEPIDLLLSMVFDQDAKRAAAEIGAGENWLLSLGAGLDSQAGPSRAILRLIYRPDVKRENTGGRNFRAIGSRERGIANQRRIGCGQTGVSGEKVSQ